MAIRNFTTAVARGDLSARVGEVRFGRSAEVLALAEEFDRMAARLKELVDGQRRLIRDVSHEMRSPLSRLVTPPRNSTASSAKPNGSRK